jgi:hypothetical protein
VFGILYIKFLDVTMLIFSDKVKENRNLLQEALMVKMEGRRLKLSSDIGEDKEISDDEIVISLMADLQEKHDSEAEAFIQKFSEQVSLVRMSLNVWLTVTFQNEEELVNLQVSLVNEIKLQIADNLAAVLLSEEHAKSKKEELISALDAKYDSLRDKLIMEALVKQVKQ